MTEIKPMSVTLAALPSRKPGRLLTSRKQRIKTGNGLAQKLRDSIQAWQERFSLENPRLIQRYKKGELNVLLKFSTGLIPKKYVIVFEGKCQVADEQIPRIGSLMNRKEFRVKGRHVNSEISADDSDWEPMLIDDAQAVQAPENLPFSSLVWFNLADRVYSILPHAFYLSKARGFVLAGTRARKLNPLTFASVCATPERATEIVQGSPEVVNDITNDGGDQGIDWLYVREAIRRASICIHLADRFVWPTPYEFGDLDFKILDVMVGPFDLDPDRFWNASHD
jgi:hypothetical protein